MLAGLHRTPAVFRSQKLSFKGATLEAALESLADEKPWVLMDTAFQKADGSAQIVIPLDAMNRGEEPFAALVGREAQKLTPPSSLVIAMHPIF